LRLRQTAQHGRVDDGLIGSRKGRGFFLWSLASAGGESDLFWLLKERVRGY